MGAITLKWRIYAAKCTASRARDNAMISEAARLRVRRQNGHMFRPIAHAMADADGRWPQRA